MRRALAVMLVLAAVGCSDEDPGSSGGAPLATTTATTVPPPGATTTTTIDPLGGFVPAPLSWAPCGRVECATLTVPLDWSQPSGSTIELAVTRVPASGGEAVGGIALNPGGPGASGNEFIAGGAVFPGALAERFDAISWDPRGLGGSAPLGCDGAEVDAFVRLDMAPDDVREQADLESAAQAVGAACAATAGELLPFVGTDDTARDLEAIRRAYGAPLGYLGLSYGTVIGLRHLALFPDALSGVVLDGVVDPADSLTDLLRSQAVAFESALADLLEEGGAESAYDRLAASLEQEPLPAAGGRALSAADLTTAAIYASYSASAHATLLEGIVEAESGDGSTLADLAEAFRGLVAFDLYQAVSCLDSANPVGPAAWAAFADEVEAVAPRVGGAVANEMLPCATWPVPPRPITGPVVAEGSGPVLVLGTTGDPVTPVEQAETVASVLANGRYVSVDGETHVAFFSNACAQELVSAFFVDGVVPAEGTTC